MRADNSDDQRRARMRRNLRIFAIIIALYYFGSAGYSYYQEQQRAKEDQILSEYIIHKPKEFRDFFNNTLVSLNSTLPTANATDSVDGFVAVLSPQIELSGYTNKTNPMIEGVQLQTRYSDLKLNPEAKNAIIAFVASCLKTNDKNTITTVLNSLGIDINNDQYTFDNLENTQLVYNNVIFDVSLVKDVINEFTIKAKVKESK